MRNRGKVIVNNTQENFISFPLVTQDNHYQEKLLYSHFVWFHNDTLKIYKMTIMMAK